MLHGDTLTGVDLYIFNKIVPQTFIANISVKSAIKLSMPECFCCFDALKYLKFEALNFSIVLAETSGLSV